jgi:hypothetical protein
MCPAHANLPVVADSDHAALEAAIRTGDKQALIHELERRVDRDDLAVAIGAAMAAIPIAGPALQVLLDEYMPKRRQQRLATAVAEICFMIKTIDERVSREFVTTEEFEGLFRETLQRLQIEHRQQKRQAFEAILVNSLLPEKRILYDQNSLFLNLVDQLLEPQLHILRALWSLDRSEPSSEIKRYPTLLAFFSTTLDTTSAIVAFLCKRLDDYSLTKDLIDRLTAGPAVAAGGDQQNAPYLTDLGFSFLTYITPPLQPTTSDH